MVKRILVVPGDGIGQEVMLEAKKLLAVIAKKFALEFSLEEVDWGADKWLREGIGLPHDAIVTIPQKFDAILFGALGDPRIPDMAHGREILLGLRCGLELFINLRPIKLLHPRLNVLKNIDAQQIDMVIFRENTQDIYQGLGESFQPGTNGEIAVDESRHTFDGVQRIIRAAFEYAERHKRTRVTLVDKANAIKFGGRLWSRVFKSVAAGFPHITADHLYVDVAAMQMVQNPGRFEVIVTSNLFGDILSDLGAALGGGLGLAASANINPKTVALFEPVHGSAPDIAFKNMANPFAMFLCVAMMLRHFGHDAAAKSIEDAVVSAIDRHATTKDLGGRLSCSEAGQQILTACS